MNSLYIILPIMFLVSVVTLIITAYLVSNGLSETEKKWIERQR